MFQNWDVGFSGEAGSQLVKYFNNVRTCPYFNIHHKTSPFSFSSECASHKGTQGAVKNLRKCSTSSFNVRFRVLFSLCQCRKVVPSRYFLKFA